MERNMSNSKPNYTPDFPEIAAEFSLVAAAVYGVIWRCAQMPDGAYHASYETLAAEIGVHKNSVSNHVQKLLDERWLTVMFSDDMRSN